MRRLYEWFSAPGPSRRLRTWISSRSADLRSHEDVVHVVRATLVVAVALALAASAGAGPGIRHTMTGSPGPDTLLGTKAPDLIVGGAGHDELYGGGGGGGLHGGTGKDHP